MVWKDNAGKHNVHDRCMIRDENIRNTFVFLLFRKFNEIISETHSVKHSETPESDKFIAVLIMLFVKG